jgi:hypothetical protein
LELRPTSNYGSRIWYPYLEDAFDKTLAEQVEWADKLEHAGIHDWRLAEFWETVPLKASMFGGLTLGGVNVVVGINSAAYFAPTACGVGGAVPGQVYSCVVLGRTANEDGLVSGAIINPWEFVPGGQFPPAPPPNPRYVADADVARVGFGFGSVLTVYYNLPRSEAQDHWFYFPVGNQTFPAGSSVYNDDLNYNRDDTTLGEMSPVDEVTGERPIGAWTTTDAIPELDTPGRCGREDWRPRFNTVKISDVQHPDGYLVPVDIFQVLRYDWNRAVGRRARDVWVRDTSDAAVAKIWSRRGFFRRVYEIHFSDGERDYAFQVAVPSR